MKYITLQHVVAEFERPRALCLRISRVRPSQHHAPSVRGGQRCKVALFLCGEPSKTGDGDGVSDLFEADDLLESPAVLRRAMDHFLSWLSAADAAAAHAQFVAQLDDLASDLEDGTSFQFAAASVWMVYDAPRRAAINGQGASANGVAPAPSEVEISDEIPEEIAEEGIDSKAVVRLSHFAGLSMHRSPGHDVAFLEGLRALRAAVLRARAASPTEAE